MIDPGDDALFERVADYFSVLSDPTRLKILRALCEGEMNVGDVVEAVGASQTNVSRHLALLHTRGVVARRREGAMVYYAMADGDVQELCRLACEHLARVSERSVVPKTAVRRGSVRAVERRR